MLKCDGADTGIELFEIKIRNKESYFEVTTLFRINGVFNPDQFAFFIKITLYVIKTIGRFTPVGGGGGNCTPVQKKTQTGHSMLSDSLVAMEGLISRGEK